MRTNAKHALVTNRQIGHPIVRESPIRPARLNRKRRRTSTVLRNRVPGTMAWSPSALWTERFAGFGAANRGKGIPNQEIGNERALIQTALNQNPPCK